MGMTIRVITTILIGIKVIKIIRTVIMIIKTVTTLTKNCNDNTSNFETITPANRQ